MYNDVPRSRYACTMRRQFNLTPLAINVPARVLQSSSTMTAVPLHPRVRNVSFHRSRFVRFILFMDDLLSRLHRLDDRFTSSRIISSAPNNVEVGCLKVAQSEVSVVNVGTS